MKISVFTKFWALLYLNTAFFRMHFKNYTSSLFNSSISGKDGYNSNSKYFSGES